ncbi:MAG: hypothetical protein J7L46_05540 [Bacteroidales bacterium]|nr:hypothetical protein [Bacteroidales bacterium]
MIKLFFFVLIVRIFLKNDNFNPYLVKMPNPIYIPLIFLAAIVFGLFLRKSRNLTVLLLFLVFLLASIIPLFGFWQVFFHHLGAGQGSFFGLPIPSIVFDEHRLLLLGFVNLAGLFSGFFLINFFQSKPIVKLLAFLLFFFSVNLIILSSSILITVMTVLLALFSFAGLFNKFFGTKVSQITFLIFFSAAILLITGLLIMVFSGVSLQFQEIPDISNFFFFAGFLLLFGTFPITSATEKGLSIEKGIFLLLFQGVFLSVIFFVFYLLSKAIVNESMLNAMAIMGLLTYFSASFMATGQVSAAKILSYNTTGQFGLMISIIGLSRYLGIDSFFILAGIFLTHFFAKTGILWLTSDMAKDKITDWSSLRKKIIPLFFFGVFVFALIGFPPFPSFFSRWQLLEHLISYQMYDWIIFFGLAFLLEAYYLLRWVAGISRKEKNPHFIQISPAGWLSATVSFILLIISSGFTLLYLNNINDLQLYILILMLLLFLLSFTPPIVQFIFSLSFLLNYHFLMDFSLHDVRLIPIGIILLFAILLLISNLRKYKHQPSLNTIILLMAWSVILPIVATKWMTVVFWGFLFIASIFIFTLHKEKLKGNGLFFALLALTGILTVIIGLQSVIIQTGKIEIAAFSWSGILLTNKILIITGTALVFIAVLIALFSAMSRKNKTATGYFSFRNILAESIDELLSSQIIFSVVQIFLVIGVFGILVFSNFF